MLKFIEAQVEGYGSYVEPFTHTFEEGIIFLKGKNGIGKSTFFSAIAWGLYGQNNTGLPTSAVQSWEELHTKNFKGTRVILKFLVGDKEYVIARHLKYNGTTYGISGKSDLMLFKGFENPTIFNDLDKAQVQERILGLIESSYNTFINTVFFGQRMVRLIQSDNDTKREVLEKLFEADFIEQCKKEATNTLKEVKTEVAVITSTISNAKQQIEKQEKVIAELEIIKAQFETNKAHKIRVIELAIDDAQKTITSQQTLIEKTADNLEQLTDRETALKAEIAFIEQSLVDYNKAKNYLEQSNNLLTTKQNNALLLKQQLQTLNQNREFAIDKINILKQKLEDSNSDVCGTCGANKDDWEATKKSEIEAVSSSKIKEQLHKAELEFTNLEVDINKTRVNLVDLEAGVATLQNELKEHSTSFDKMRTEFSENEAKLTLYKKNLTGLSEELIECSQELFELQSRVKQNKYVIQHKQEEIEKVKSEKFDATTYNTLLADLDELKEQVKVNSTYLIELEAKQRRLEWWNNIGFGANGIKAMIFNSMLTTINQKIEKYANRLGIKIEVSMDMEKSNKSFLFKCFKDINGTVRQIDYRELSGGQKQRIDIALAFAMHDLVSSKLPVNLLILDEFTEGLDAEGLGTVFDFLNIKLKENTDLGIYFVTHQPSITMLNAKEYTITSNQSLIQWK